MKAKQIERTATPKSSDCEKAGLVEEGIQDAKAQRLLAIQVAKDALDKVKVLSDGSVADFPKNLKSLVQSLQKLILMLKMLGEDS